MAKEYSFLVQEQWFEVPSNRESLASISPLLEALVDGEDARARLQSDAERLVDTVADNDEPGKRTWGAVGERDTGTISAVMTVETIRERGVDLDGILAEWSSTESGGGLDTWLSDYRKKELAGRPAVSGRHILQWPADESGQRRLAEIYRAVISTPWLSTFIVMTITTDDLSVFDDIVGYGDILADTFEFARATPAA